MYINIFGTVEFLKYPLIKLLLLELISNALQLPACWMRRRCAWASTRACWICCVPRPAPSTGSIGCSGNAKINMWVHHVGLCASMACWRAMRSRAAALACSGSIERGIWSRRIIRRPCRIFCVNLPALDNVLHLCASVCLLAIKFKLHSEKKAVASSSVIFVLEIPAKFPGENSWIQLCLSLELCIIYQKVRQRGWFDKDKEIPL